MSRLGRISRMLIQLAAISALAAGCTAVDEPGSRGPDRSSTTTTLPAEASAPISLSCGTGGAGGEVDTALSAPHQAAIDDALRAPEFHGLDISVSIWIDGHGEVAAVNPDTRLLPASNQKLFTAIGALATLPGDHRFVTEVRHDDGVLTLVAGGDPTLRLSGAHSLAALARQVAERGITGAEVVAVDASHFEFNRMAVGWQDWHIPDYVGPLSAFTVNDNRHRTDDDYLFSPAIGNLEAFASALRSVGVDIGGARIEPATEARGEVVATLRSAPVSTLVADMLTRSDNETAEALLREVGDGSTATGITTVDSVLDPYCQGRSGASGDGSGLSRANLRSAREWRSLLQAVAAAPWGNELRAGLPVAGRTGTLAGRLGGQTTRGNVTAKTGSIIGGQALSGYATTAEGREMIFSIIVNGDAVSARAARPAIDALVTAAVGET